MAILGFAAGISSPALRRAPVRTSSAINPRTEIQDENSPLAVALGELQEDNKLKMVARLATVAKSLDAAQWAALLERAEVLPWSKAEEYLPLLLTMWTQSDRAAATAWIQPRLDLFPRAIGLDTRLSVQHFRLIEGWAENAPEEAFEYARKLHPA
jgi:hypothetical protein